MAPGRINFARMFELTGSSGSMHNMNVFKSPVYSTEKSLIAPVTPQNSKILSTLFREILLSVIMYDLRQPAALLSPTRLTG